MPAVPAEQHKREHCKEKGADQACVLCGPEAHVQWGFCKPHEVELIRIIDSIQPQHCSQDGQEYGGQGQL
ncbi:MAG: hypothetical protein IBX40_00950 [Methanosarcinales archaeon]|nr:hypothetical protein [Methanosarcinales archaeon]